MFFSNNKIAQNDSMQIFFIPYIKPVKIGTYFTGTSEARLDCHDILLNEKKGEICLFILPQI